MKEQWETIPNLTNYQISNLGRVKSIGRKTPATRTGFYNSVHLKYSVKPKILKQTFLQGRMTVNVKENGKDHLLDIARLVAVLFVSNKKHYPCVVHCDGDPKNNRADNLIWGLNRHCTNVLLDNGQFRYFKSKHDAAGWLIKNLKLSLVERTLTNKIQRRGKHTKHGTYISVKTLFARKKPKARKKPSDPMVRFDISLPKSQLESFIKVCNGSKKEARRHLSRYIQNELKEAK